MAVGTRSMTGIAFESGARACLRRGEHRIAHKLPRMAIVADAHAAWLGGEDLQCTQ